LLLVSAKAPRFHAQKDKCEAMLLQCVANAISLLPADLFHQHELHYFSYFDFIILPFLKLYNIVERLNKRLIRLLSSQINRQNNNCIFLNGSLK